jgi:hypothetical protein
MMPFANNESLSTNLERSLLLTIKASFEQRGYKYTEIMDSADFVVQAECRDGYNLGKKLKPLVEHTPPLIVQKPVRFIDLISTGFTPIPRDLWFQLSSPLLFIHAYDRNKNPLGTWVAGAEQRNGNYEEASRRLMDDVAEILPTNWLTDDPASSSPGIVGFYAEQNQATGYLEVKTIVERSPADYGGLMEGDQLLKFDSINLKNCAWETFRELNRGEAGTPRSYLIHRRPDTTFVLTLIMARRDTTSRRNRLILPGLGRQD